VPLVNVMVNGRAYTLNCDDGEEENLKELAARVNEKVRELLGQVGQVGDQRLLLMAALLIADEHQAALKRLDESMQELEALKLENSDLGGQLDKSQAVAADRLESAAIRLEDVAAKLARA
jgi:cell division protein ZapA